MTLSFEKLSEKQVDVLKEIANIGAGHATTALFQMIGHRIDLQVPRVTVLPLSAVPDALGGPEKLVIGLFLKIYGDATGNILIMFPVESASLLLKMLLGDSKYDALALLDESEISALKELGNILSASYLNAIARFLNIMLIPSVPGFSCDMAGAVVDYILIELGKVANVALLMETNFTSLQGNMNGHFFLLPDYNSLEIFLRSAK
ncbi:MAG: CheY-P-specific phosphatase CheC [Candidatus Fischerbacteria bacterium RBG_13_37_8]|uniref:CheY-P-specific phosphatase CheC n=1 Tax=Candidatus Fischerbacteria bacterium RBG_13_37_8 TaxID=1817863 RepID=A0A1F5VNJ3_9BACT|nr:MAG: CheY-P-specific phosphatase CheC [Candidatus Fischerbacteria bacterium RBG_13_37_8]